MEKSVLVNSFLCHSGSNSRNSGAFSEQLSELHSRPVLFENPHSQSNSRNWLDANISAQIIRIEVVPARQNKKIKISRGCPGIIIGTVQAFYWDFLGICLCVSLFAQEKDNT